MNDGRKTIDAELAAARQDRARARALGTGRELGRSNRRLPLYGFSAADTGAVPMSADEIGFMATDGSSSSHSQHNGEAGYQRYQLEYQQARRRPPGTTQGHTGLHRTTTEVPHDRLYNMRPTPHALKLLEHGATAPKGAMANANVGNGGGSEILLTPARRPSRPRLRRAASRSRSLDRLAPS